MTRATGMGVVVVLVTALACHAPPPLDGLPSAERLAGEVLAALERRDTDRLERLALNAPEFERHIWPSLPAARPERNLPVDYVWSDLRQKSEAMLRRTLRQHGGRRFTLDSVRFDGSTTDHGRFRVHRRTVLVVRDSSGAKLQLAVLGSMIESEGVWRVLSYVIDD